MLSCYPSRQRSRPADLRAAALYSPTDLPVGTRRRRRPFEDHGVATLYSPADLPVGTRRRCRPSEDDSGLAKRLEQMAKERERRERAAAAADEEFSAEVLTAARKVRSSVQSSPVPARAFVLLLVLCRVSLDLNAPSP